MGVTTTQTNKPFNPRGNDQSPLAYNRAKLFSGKALDFDGVNDEVNIGAEGGTYNDFTLVWNLKTSYNGAFQAIFSTGSLQDFYIDPSGQFRIFIGTSYDTTTLPAINSGEWVNLVFTRSGSTGSFYYNGVLVETLTISNTALNNTDARIGANQYGSYPFNGEMAGFKLFNTALTAAQVADLYNNPEKVVPTGVDNTALKLWLPMQEGAGTKCLDGASLNTATERVENGDFSDGTTGWVGNPETTLSVSNGQLDIQSASGAGQYGAAFSEVNFTSGKYYLFQLDIVSCNVPSQIRIGASNSATLYSQNIWASGEIGVGTHSILWLAPSNYTYLSIGGRNDVTTLVIDNVSVKEINVGDISGATWTHGIGAPVAQTSVIDWNKTILDKTSEVLIPQGLTSGRDLLGNLFENVRKQGALNLDGESWAEVHDNESLDISPAMTMEVWIKCGDELDSDYDHIFVKPTSAAWSSPYGTYVLRLNNSGIQWWFDSVSNATSHSVVLTGWNHLSITKTGTAEILYLNGVQVKTFTGAATISLTAFDLIIGTLTSKVPSESVANQIAQPRIYNRALTAAEVLRNYNSGKNTYTND